jgi:hypothetical protein
MDAFQRSEAKRALLTKSIAPCWVEFRSAVESLVRSYNETQDGRFQPATISLSSDHAILISSARGMAEDEFHNVTLIIKISLDEGEYVISATRETWLTRQGLNLSKQDEDSYSFKLDGDPEEGKVGLTSTAFGNCTPSKAAEALLVKTLTP